jgi:hypothetical protein
MSEESSNQLCSEAEALYAALSARYGLVVRGDLQALQRARQKFAKDDEALQQLSVLGPDTEGRLWLVRRAKLARIAE